MVVICRVMENFLSNKKVNNNETLETNLLAVFHDLGSNINVKFHFLYSNLEKFLENLGAVSDEQGEWFQHDLKTME